MYPLAWHPHGNKRMMPMGHHGYREKTTFMDQEPRWLDNSDDIPIYHDRGMERRRSPKEWCEEDWDGHRQWERRSGSRAPEYSERDHYRHQMPRGRPWANNTPSSAMPFDARTVRNAARGGSGDDGGGVRDRSFSPHERGDNRRRSYSPNNDSYEPEPGRWMSGRSYERERLPPLLPGGRSVAGDRRSVSPPPPPHFQGRPSFTEWNDAPGRLKPAKPEPKRRSPLLAHPKAYGSTLPAAGHAVGVSPKPHTVTRQSKGKSAEPPKTKLGFRSPSASPKVLDAAQPPTQSGQSNSSLAAEEVVSSAVTQAVVAAVKNASPKPSDCTERTNLAGMVVGADACVGLSFSTNGVPKDHPKEAFGPTFPQKFGPKGDEDKGRVKFAESSVAGKPREGRPATDAAGGAPPEPVIWNCGKRLAAAGASGGIPFLSSVLQEQQQQQQQDSLSSPAVRGVGKPLCRGGFAEISPSSDEPAAARLEKKASVGPAGPSDGAVGSSVATPPVGIGDAEAAAMSVKKPEGEKHLDTVDEEVLKKRREIEQAYREDCETFCTVVRMLVDKDPSLENSVQASLRANIVEMGQQSLEQLRNFVASRKRLRSKEHSPALPQVWPAP
ncbi:periphilin-1 isoform X2 [Petromyzon marinus]|uniref:periphilin-1 isoform X2 n=1 Tax=Petromyzon marinus TaxID=7757 RepID=UPI003F71D48E